MLYVSSAQTSECGSNSAVASDNTNIAYAGHCQQEQALDRSVCIVIKLCGMRSQSKTRNRLIRFVTSVVACLSHTHSIISSKSSNCMIYGAQCIHTQAEHEITAGHLMTRI